jgi:hypothetical protein
MVPNKALSLSLSLRLLVPNKALSLSLSLIIVFDADDARMMMIDGFYSQNGRGPKPKA